MKTVTEEAHDLVSQMPLSELKSLAKVLGWDKETEHEKLPNWYGIPNIKFIWINTQADPLIEYKGRRCSCYVVEDTMWYYYTHDDDDNEIPAELCKEEDFAKYMQDNKEMVYELCENALFGENVE